MYNPNLKLTELFLSNSLRNMTTPKQSPMPHSGNTYFLSTYSLDEGLVKDLLERGDKFSPGGSSINSYIGLTDRAGDLITSRLISHGPGSSSSSLKICFLNLEAGKIRILAQGWGSSSIELYDGEEKYFLQYLLDHQKRATK